MRPDAVQIFKALGDSNRLRIVRMLQQRELCMCEIRSVLKLSNSTVSEHLSILKEAGLIIDRKDGKWVNYRLSEGQSNSAIIAVLKMLKESFPEDAALKSDRVKVKSADREKICCLNKKSC
jgi:ArsR family transcriptional regulator